MSMEYRISLWNRILFYLLGAFFILLPAILSVSVTSSKSVLASGVLIAVVLPFGLFFIGEAVRFRLVVDDQSLTVTHVFSSRSVLLDEIAGYRKGSKGTIWLDLKSGGRALTVSNSMERQEEFLQWLKERYPDRDVQLALEIKEEVLHDERFGGTEEERAAKLARARKLMIYFMFAPTLLLWVAIKPQPFRLLMVTLLAIPVLAVWLTWYYKGILQVFIYTQRPYPSLLFGIIGVEVAALVAIIRVYNIYLFDGHSWLLLIACSVILAFAWAVACRAALAGKKNRVVAYGGMLLLAGIYSYNALVFFNCSYDTHSPEKWIVGIDRKHVQHGRNSSYWLHLSPWGRYQNGMSLSVESSFYRSVSTGDTVDVLLHPGQFGIQWYEITKEGND